MTGPKTDVNAVIAHPMFSRLKAHVVESTGLAYYQQRDTDLAARLRRRMVATGSPDCAHYLSLLLSPGNAEREAMIQELTIGETHFFRFQEQFEALRQHVFPAVIRENREVRRLRIWSAGCAVGPEPYSVAILLQREFGKHLAGWDVSILGTDINQEFLRRASEGIFAEWALRGLPDALRGECFTPTPAGWRIREPYRQWTKFQYHNLVTDSIPTIGCRAEAFDVVLCRNVMIYFSQETIRGLVSILHQSLMPNGWLLVGHAEGNQEWFPGFESRPMQGTMLYQRKQAGAQADMADADGALAPGPTNVPAPKPANAIDDLLSWRPHLLAPLFDGQSPSGQATGQSSDGSATEVREPTSLGTCQAAAPATSRSMALEPLDALAHFHRGLTLSQQGDPIAAEAAFRRAIFLDGDLALAYYHLGLLMADRSDFAGAMKAFRNSARALRTTPDDSVLDEDGLTAGRLQEAVVVQLRSLEHE